MSDGKESRYKFFWIGNPDGTGGVGVLLAEKWVEKVLDIKRVSDRIMIIKLIIGRTIVTILSVYAPQVGLEDKTKDAFYDDMLRVISKVSDQEILIPCGDWNGHIGKVSAGYDGVHGGHGFGERNQEGERVLEFAAAHNLVVVNSFFSKRDNHLLTYQSGDNNTQIDYILCRKRDLRLVKDAKVIPGEECGLQHRLLVCVLKISPSEPRTQQFIPKRRIWKLTDPDCKTEFARVADEKLRDAETAIDPDIIWEHLKSSLLNTTEEVCGWTKKRPMRRQTWWWSDAVNSAVKTKRKLWKAWKKGGSKEEYMKAKRDAKRAVYGAKKEAEESKFRDLKGGNDNIFRIAKQMRQQNQDVIGEKCIKDDNNNMAFDDETKKVAWKQHYERLLNVEFEWNRNDLPVANPVHGPPIHVSFEMVAEAVGKMKTKKAPGPSGVVAEMLKAAGDSCIRRVTDLVNAIISSGSVPREWNESYILNCYKGKGDALERGNYRGLKLLDQVMKALERVLEKVIREMINIDEMQFGFMPGRGTTDAIFIVRQLQEKFIGKKRNLYFAFVDLEKAFDRVPRDVLWWAMRSLGVAEWVVKLVQSMYVNSSSRVRVGSVFSDLFDVKVGVHQGSVLSPILFIIVLEALSRQFRTSCPWELLYADDLVITAETLEDLIEKLKMWKSEMEAKGLRVNMGKTKIMCSGTNLNVLKDSGKFPCGVCRTGVGSNSIFCTGCEHWIHKKCSHTRGKLKVDPNFKCDRCKGVARPIDGRPLQHVMIDGHKLEVVDTFCYLGDTICAGGGCSATTIARARSAWGKFRELLPILTCRSLCLLTRGNVFNIYVRSVLLHASECWALRNEDRTRLERNDRSMIRWICGVRVKDKVSMASLYERLGIPSLDAALRRNRLRWFGHVERSDTWIKRCTAILVEGDAGRGRPRKTWRETIEDDLRSWRLTSDMVYDRDDWRRKVRAAAQVQPPGKGKED